MILKSVDLPQPDGPMMPTNSPGATDNETPSTAMTAPSGVSNRLVMLSTARMAVPAAASGPDGLTAVNAVATAMRPLSPRCPPRTWGASGHIAHHGLPPHWRLRIKNVAATGASRFSGQFRLIGPTGPPAPVLPGPVEGVGAGARDHLVDLAGGEELDVPHRHRLHLQLGVHLQVDRDEHGVANVRGRDRRAMAAHEDARARPDRTGEIAPHVDALDQQCSVAELVMRIPGRHLVADIGAHVQQRLELALGDAERDHARAVVVYDRVHIRPRLIDAAVDETLE